MRLEALLLTALVGCIPGDTHFLRQGLKTAKMLQRKTHELNIIGRHVLIIVYEFFAMNNKDNSMPDAARLHKVTLHN